MTRALATAGILLMGIINPSAAQDVRGVDRVVVVDAAGRAVGDTASLAGPAGATVALDVDGHLLLLQVTRERFIGNADTAILFESTDCSGEAYVSTGPISFGPSLTAVVVGPPGQTAYSGNPAGPLATITWKSWRNRGSEDCHPQVPAVVDDVLPVIPLVNLAEIYEPPFRLVAPTTPPSTATSSRTFPAQPTPSPTAMVAPAACCGDCNADGEVRVDELITGVNRLLLGCQVP
ncbi:MAG: hypothetical protein AB7V27_15955 [Candidatus Binatia bacterium]